MIEEKRPLDSFAHLRGRALVENKAPVFSRTNKASSLGVHGPSLPFPDDVQRMMVVADMHAALPTYFQQGYSIAVEPDKRSWETYTVLQDYFGNRIGLLEQSGTEKGRSGIKTPAPREVSSII